jgi:hypothetical protein
MLTKEDYLTVLGLSFDPEAREGIDRAESYFGRMGVGPLDSMFIATSVEEPGVTAYGPLWFFTDQHFCNAQDFRNPTTAQYVIRRHNPVDRLEVQMQFVDPDDLSGLHRTSRVTVQFITSTNIVAVLAAHDQNCRQLLEVVQRFLRPGS